MKRINWVNRSRNVLAATIIAESYGYNLAEKLCLEIDRLTEQKTRFFLFFGKREVCQIFPDLGRNETTMRVVNARLNSGEIVVVFDGYFHELTTKEWAKRTHQNRPKRPRVRIPVPPEKALGSVREIREDAFQIMKQTNRYHKPAKKGFQRTLYANTLMHSM